MRAAANSSTCAVVTPGWMNAPTSLSTALATAQAGRIASKSRSLLRMIMGSRPNLRRPPSNLRYNKEPSKAAFEAAFFQKPVIMTHQQMGFHLAHRIQEHPDHDQHARAAKKL